MQYNCVMTVLAETSGASSYVSDQEQECLLENNLHLLDMKGCVWNVSDMKPYLRIQHPDFSELFSVWLQKTPCRHARTFSRVRLSQPSPWT